MKKTVIFLVAVALSVHILFADCEPHVVFRSFSDSDTPEKVIIQGIDESFLNSEKVLFYRAKIEEGKIVSIVKREISLDPEAAKKLQITPDRFFSDRCVMPGEYVYLYPELDCKDLNFIGICSNFNEIIVSDHSVECPDSDEKVQMSEDDFLNMKSYEANIGDCNDTINKYGCSAIVI